MSGTLHMGQGHDGNKTSQMEALGRGVKPDIASDRRLNKLPDLIPIRHLLNKTPLFKDIENVRHAIHPCLRLQGVLT
jgi:hypothetical protein